jgi:hypothetical protein
MTNQTLTASMESYRRSMQALVVPKVHVNLGAEAVAAVRAIVIAGVAVAAVREAVVVAEVQPVVQVVRAVDDLRAAAVDGDDDKSKVALSSRLSVFSKIKNKGRRLCGPFLFLGTA